MVWGPGLRELTFPQHSGSKRWFLQVSSQVALCFWNPNPCGLVLSDLALFSCL